MARKIDSDSNVCSFCGRPPSPARQIVQGQSALICEDCVRFCHNFINGDLGKNKTNTFEKFINPPTPREIKKHLDTFVVGQTQAKKILSVAAYNHYKRVLHNKLLKQATGENDLKNKDDSVVLEKSNILLIGATGVGKTLLARTLAQFLQVPFAIADATSITEAGYVGEDVEHMLLKLYQSADNDLEAAQNGIIFIDEVDKISRKSKNPSITRDVSGEGVQQALLKIIEGTTALVPPLGGRKHPYQKMLQIDTSNILFICGGAFIGLEDIIKSRVIDSTLGFEANSNRVSKIHTNKEKNALSITHLSTKSQSDEVLRHLHPEDLINFGFVPEFVGRLPVVAYLETHTEKTLKRVLLEPRNSILKQMKLFFKLNDVELVFDEEAIDAIVKLAFEQKVGARGLRTIVEELLLDSMYEIPSQTDIKQVRVTKENVESRTSSIIKHSINEKPVLENLG